MYKQIGAILLVAGTCIGSGMIALPLVLAKIGLIPSIFLMISIWIVMYFTSLINLELNLSARHGLSLGKLGRLYSGKVAELIGTVSLKLLSYSLLAVFIYGGTSIFKEMIESKLELKYSFNFLATGFAFISMILLLLPIKWIDYFNRFLFIGLIIVVAVLIIGLNLTIDWFELPLISEQSSDLSVWATLIPVVFTSFGFQVIFHTLANYCKMDSKMLKRTFFWGSLIPAIVYIVWTCSILSVVYQTNPLFYQEMASGNAEIGELIQVLSGIAKWQSVQLLIWVVSLLAIATSVIGVGVGLCDSFNGMLSRKVVNLKAQIILASIITILPAYVVVILVPNAFITVLGFAGMILAIIAVLMPVYLFIKMKKNKFHYPELKKNYLILFSFLVALLVIVCEVFNML